MSKTAIALIFSFAMFAPARAQAVDAIILEFLPRIGTSFETTLEIFKKNKHLKFNGFENINGLEYAVFEYSGFPETFIHLRKEVDVVGSLKIYQNQWFNTCKDLMVKLSSKRKYDEAGEIADEYWYVQYGGKNFAAEWSEEDDYMTLMFFLDQ